MTYVGWQGARLGGALLTGQCSFVECVGDVLSVLCLIVCLEIQLCPYFIPPHYRPLTGRTIPFKPIRASGLIL